MSEDDEALGRAERRLLRRIYNGRTVPITAGGRAFLKYKEAALFLQGLDAEERAAAYAEMKTQAQTQAQTTPG